MKKLQKLFADTGVVILSGGKSSRMSYPKCFLVANERMLLEITHTVYSGFSDSVYVVLNSELSKGQWQSTFRDLSERMNFILNEYPERGRGFSVRSGIGTMTHKEFCFLQNVDNPVSRNTIFSLIANKNSEGYTVPVLNEKSGHPILISRRVMDGILAEESDNFILSDILRQYPRREVQVNDPGIFTNLNTPDDFRKFTTMVTE